MKAMRLRSPAPIEHEPLERKRLSRPQAGPGELLLRVRACGVCHTDLHLAEGEIHPPELPRTPGHQVVAEVVELGPGAEGWAVGDRAGLPWLHSACGVCAACRRGEQNLCEQARFTGFHVDGGFAEYVLAQAAFTLHLPDGLSDREAAPMLCAGIIGYRALRKADLAPGDRLGLVGFGASAHLAIQLARHWDCQVYVFTRSQGHRRLAEQLGAAWVGGIDDRAPASLDRAVIFAPVGTLVPKVLEKLRPGGTLAINAIHMSPIPEMPYPLLYGERTLRSVANATPRDGVELLQLAVAIPLKASTQAYTLDRANQALADLKHSRIDGAGVLLL